MVVRLLILILLFTLTAQAHAGQVIPGPVLCDVERVVDGDTIDVSCNPGDHREKLGRAIWVYKHLEKIADRKTGTGSSKMSHLVDALQVSRATVKRHLSTLRSQGYISTRQVQHGFEFEILKPVDMSVHKRVRIDGLDTPELKGKCASEKQRAIAAREFVEEALQGRQVYLLDIRNGKFAGRQVARVVIAGTGDDLADLTIKAGHGRPYQGGKRRGWCPLAVGATGEPAAKGGE